MTKPQPTRLFLGVTGRQVAATAFVVLVCLARPAHAEPERPSLAVPLGSLRDRMVVRRVAVGSAYRYAPLHGRLPSCLVVEPRFGGPCPTSAIRTGVGI